MLFGEGLVGLAILGLWIFCIIDVITTDEVEMRNLPKMVWLMIVVFLASIGSIAWLIAGRPQGKTFAIGGAGGATTQPADRYRADAVSQDIMSDVVREREEAARLRMWEEQLRRREEELRRKEQQGD